MIEYYYDINNIKSIWHQFQPALGRLYPNYVEEQTLNNRFLCYKINNIVAGIASYSIKNYKRLVVIDVLVTLPLYQGQGVAKALLNKIYKETESLYNNLGFRLMLEVYDGLSSNNFIQNISIDNERHISPSGKTKSTYYYLDLHKIASM